jgi:diaminohydroxyphosphoribosylaminopyrimidine deaminase/5-amino-6-(5-phosphoribosylamino)uracil reductase
MPWLQHDEPLLEHALTLARKAAAFASPNPTVGCVIATASGEILGEGAHFYDQRDHAEIVALHAAEANGRSAQGATAYVTLEPCTTHGRTGPCTDALIHAGIARCVIATADPNPLVHLRGVSRLRQAGIETEFPPEGSALITEARRLNDAFAFSITDGRPFVTLKAALSVDGMLAPPPQNRSSTAPHWLTGEAARLDVQRLRHESDCILTGIGTLLADNPTLTDRTGFPRRRPLLRVVLDSHLRTPLNSELAQTANDDVLLVCHNNAPNNGAKLEALGCEILRLPGDAHKLNLHLLFAELHRRGITSVLAESGSGLNVSLLRGDFVDRLVFYYADTELGTGAIPFASHGPSPFLLQEKITGMTRTAFPHGVSEDIRITGYLHDPWVF